jgi:hypothetical protein
MWVFYSVKNDDLPMIVRSSTEITLLAISTFYIIRNKILAKEQNKILPLSN